MLAFLILVRNSDLGPQFLKIVRFGCGFLSPNNSS